MSGLDELLDLLPPWVLVGGKGGVGKTTCAAALALRSEARGERTLLLSTDPAASLAQALEVPVAGRPAAVPGRPALEVMQLDARAARDAFLARWRPVLMTILDHGTYLDREDVAGLVDAALPGLDETMALLTLLDLAEGGWARVVLDTAPTGHTLRLLELPGAFRALVALLDAMQEKHRFMVRALTHRYRADEADRFLDEMRARIDALRATLADGARFAVVLVTRAEVLVVEETARYAAALSELGLALRAIVVNALPDGAAAEETEPALAALARIAPGVPRFSVPRLDRAAAGLGEIERWGEMMEAGSARLGRAAGSGKRAGCAALREGGDRRAWGVGGGPYAPCATPPPLPASRFPQRRSAARFPLPARLQLAILAGKGGVGKTSTACALGVAVATPERRVLVVSTDPAPSVADALAQPVGEEVVAVEGAPGLFAQQLDAPAAFARFRARYRDRVDAVFDAVLRGSFDAVHDRQITRDLLALAPPGLDELYALAALGETLEGGGFDTVIVDPAPTGHLLRLLELPALALEWSHRLLRLMLKYKEVIGLGAAAEELLAFARRTRALSALLRDPSRAGVLVVALDEPLVRAETSRLVERLRALGLAVPGVLWNRLVHSPEPLPTARSSAQFEAMLVTPPPRGVEALRRWVHTWKPLSPNAHG